MDDFIKGTKDQWKKAREALLVKEKEMTRKLDALAAERRRLPWVRVTKKYSFEGTDGLLELNDLFEGRRQLIVYHHMLKPNDPSPCSGCSMVMDNITHLSHLHTRDTTFVAVARAPIDEIEAFRKRMGWDIPWKSTLDEFNDDFDVSSGFGLNVFIQEDGEIYRTYHTNGRSAEYFGTAWSLLDLTPYGRQENWENSPKSVPQSKPYVWWRLHDEY